MFLDDLIVFIMGKSSCGKDTISRYLKQKYNIEPIVSYSTRPIRVNEVNGREHYFVDDETMDSLRQRDDLIAYTKFPKTGYQYCATKEGMTQKVMTYIIDPAGVEWFKENGTSDLNTVCIYVDLDEDVIRTRALNRGDDATAIDARLASEREMFDAFKESGEYDYLINTNKPLESVYAEVDKIMEEVLKKYE